jgi:hypothetical protein
VLHFTIKLAPERTDTLRRDQLLSTPLYDTTSTLWQIEGPPDFQQAPQLTANPPIPGLLISPWAEVAYFVAPTGETAGSIPLYALYRRVRLLVSPQTSANVQPSAVTSSIGLYPGVSCEVNAATNTLYFNNELDVAERPYAGRLVKRAMMNANPATWQSAPVPVGTSNGESPTLQGDDLLVNDVISFEIKVLRAGDTQFRDLSDAAFTLANGGTPPYVNIDGVTQGIYDTATTNQTWLQLKAIEITIRAWDFKSQQAQQVTIIQDL